jgi:hypothetical protein
MSLILLNDNTELDVSEIDMIAISHTLKSEIITLHLKSYETRELIYETRYERDQDLDYISSAHREYNGIEEPEGDRYDGETLC